MNEGMNQNPASIRALALPLFVALSLTGARIALAAADPLAPTGQWTASTRGTATTPPMGWNSWNAFRTEVNEDKVMGAAQALVDTGLAKLGYVYVNIDDGWWLKRRQSDQTVQIRTGIFPSAKIRNSQDTSFKPFVDRLHSMGLKAGLYTDIGRNACSQAYDLHSPNLPEGTVAEREVGLFGHVDADIGRYFQDWGFDYLKVDACGVADYGADRAHVKTPGYRAFEPLIVRSTPAREHVAEVRALYENLSDALHRHNPDNDYVLSICTWGQVDVREWGKSVGNSWRTSGDIYPRWSRMLHSFDSAATRALYAHPGAWNDPDMLFVGAGDFDEQHLTEARSHFTLWAMINSPLLIGYDLRKAPKSLLDIWGNSRVVAINQDRAGNQAVLAYRSDDVDILVKALSDGTKAVTLFNRGLQGYDIVLTADHLKFARGAPVTLRDVWNDGGSTAFTGELKIKVAARESRTFIASGTRLLPDGVYLSEMPGGINVAEDGVRQREPDPELHRSVSWEDTRGSGDWPVYTGWGGAQADASPYSTALSVGGENFRTGIGVLANSRLEVRAQGFKRFTARVGIDDATRNRGTPVQFLVYGDGKLLEQSAPIAFGNAGAPLSVDLDGVAVVELVAKATDAQAYPVAVAWAEAALTR
jgi:alpha-galactosidase